MKAQRSLHSGRPGGGNSTGQAAQTGGPHASGAQAADFSAGFVGFGECAAGPPAWFGVSEGAGPGPAAAPAVSGVTGVILAGGASSRMGSNKALLPYRGGVFIEAIFREMSRLFAEVLLITNSPEQYRFLPCPKVPDLYPGMGALAGLHAGLSRSAHPAIFAVACDMPYLNRELIQRLAAVKQGYDAVIPRTPAGYEPLHAIYDKRCLPAMENCLDDGRRRILAFLPRISLREFSAEEIVPFDPSFSCFSNINTPEEYFQLRESEQR